mmetsp:Transcript_39981/g.83619  ORF Transcript_39981/g.83619 Transcript_39981/m.83619 type:complete len:805 (+) Transcript_39981:175-2589(+)
MASVSCNGCHKQFSSKNQLFRHLKKTAKTCLTPEEYEEFSTHVLSVSREKIGVLYGYLPGTGVDGGRHAAWLVKQAIDRLSRGVNGTMPENGSSSWSADAAIDSKIIRSYGSVSRESESSVQDPHTGAITEVMCTTALPLFVDDNYDETNTGNTKAEEELKKKTRVWVGFVNEELKYMLSELVSTSPAPSSPCETDHEWSRGRIRVFGRVKITQKRFHAETDVTHRRMDYCFPADLMYGSKREGLSKTAVQPEVSSRQEYCDSLPSFPPGNKPYSAGESRLPHSQFPLNNNRPSEKTLSYLYEMKKVMKKFTTQIEDFDSNDTGAVIEKEFSDAKRKKKKQKASKNMASSTTNAKDESPSDRTPLSSKRLLKRKRFHNFCPHILAHDFLSYRRVDRIFHRATIRLDDSVDIMIRDRPFVVFSLTGDLFLQEQCRRVIGLLIAIFRGLIDDDIIDCVFDEEFTSLVPAPPAPRIGLLSGEATYATWEGKMKTILNARRTDRYSKGWNDEEVVNDVEDWETSVLKNVASRWYCDGVAEDGRLNTETQWLEKVLKPWARQAWVSLTEYRLWKASKGTTSTLDISLLPSLKSISPVVSPLFEKVLHYLRQADKSGLWPTTTPNRQLVMLSTSNEGSQAKALSVSHMAAKKNKDSRSSAYSFKEGGGGASGSFSVGAMPGDQCSQPKGNLLFPELVKAAFELEVALCPDREPSSTIAINRNAQFRPHTDSGAGAGQSTSLIVGLGDYTGGELVVEGAKKDIRFKGIEFNGWKERHWTLPFQGERYSLVWFTPVGCEGVRGIDLTFGISA